MRESDGRLVKQCFVKGTSENFEDTRSNKSKKDRQHNL